MKRRKGVQMSFTIFKRGRILGFWEPHDIIRILESLGRLSYTPSDFNHILRASR
jgi:hypothetical protein